MKRTVGIAIAGLAVCVAAVPQTPVPPKTASATHVTNQIDDFIAKLPKGRILDNPIVHFDGKRYRSMCPGSVPGASRANRKGSL
jgi:hypothetical protein